MVSLCLPILLASFDSYFSGFSDTLIKILTPTNVTVISVVTYTLKKLYVPNKGLFFGFMRFLNSFFTTKKPKESLKPLLKEKLRRMKKK